MTHKTLIFWFVKEHFSKPFLQITFLALCAALLSTPIPFIYRDIIDGLGIQPGTDIFYLALLYVLLVILNVLTGFWKQMVLMGFQYKAAFTITTDVYRKVIKLPYHIAVTRGTADVIKLIQEDANNLYNTITFGTINLISLLIQFAIDLVIMYILFGWGVLAVIVVMPVYYYLIKKSVKNVEDYGRDYDEKREMWFEDSYSPLYRLKEVKSRRLERFLLANICKSNQQVYESGERYGRVSTVLYSLYEFFDRGVYVIIFLAGVYGVIQGYLTLGTLFAIFYVSSSIITNLNSLSLAINNDYHQKIPSLDRLADLYSIEVHNPQKQPPDMPILNVEFKGVRFFYSDSQFELSIPSLILSWNKRYVLVGRTGAGKSTIFDLLNGIRIPQEGSILINGLKTSEISEDWWKKNCFVLLQDSYIFRGSIEDNILMDDTALRANLNDIIEEYGFTSFFTRFVDGIMTSPKEGISLSGGEKRIVCLLRLLLKQQYKMILIDEGKAGLDAELRAKIDFLMKKVMDSRLSVTITHDLNEITNYDEVLFVSNGIVLQDKHENLLTNSEDYRDLVKQENNYEVVKV